jgi:hypothetical protein
MDEKDTLRKMFMDMGKANQWAREVMNPNQTGFVSSDGNFTPDEEYTIADTGENLVGEEAIKYEEEDELGWSDKKIEYKTIWEFTGQSAGKDLGKIVFNASLEQGVKSIKKAQSGSEIEYRAYPEAWLEMWFRDYDAKLSMEVYNKAKAKEALNQINNKNK